MTLGNDDHENAATTTKAGQATSGEKADIVLLYYMRIDTQDEHLPNQTPALIFSVTMP